MSTDARVQGALRQTRTGAAAQQQRRTEGGRAQSTTQITCSMRLLRASMVNIIVHAMVCFLCDLHVSCACICSPSRTARSVALTVCCAAAVSRSPVCCTVPNRLQTRQTDAPHRYACDCIASARAAHRRCVEHLSLVPTASLDRRKTEGEPDDDDNRCPAPASDPRRPRYAPRTHYIACPRCNSPLRIVTPLRPLSPAPRRFRAAVETPIGSGVPPAPQPTDRKFGTDRAHRPASLPRSPHHS